MVKIKLARLSDLDRVKEIVEACAEKMIEDNNASTHEERGEHSTGENRFFQVSEEKFA